MKKEGFSAGYGFGIAGLGWIGGQLADGRDSGRSYAQPPNRIGSHLYPEPSNKGIVPSGRVV